jgi:transmembrane protein EpsG
MLVFWVNLAVVWFCSALARQTKPASLIPRPIPGFYRLPLLFAAMSLVLVSGLRSNIGDTYYYMHSYARTTYTWDIIAAQKDIGFNLFQMGLQFVSKDPQFMIFVVALLTNAMIVAVLHRYSKLFELSMFVYVASGMYLTSMNGIRQYLAAAILFAGTKYILDGSWKKYALVVATASLFHATAVVMLPLFFLARRKAWSWTTAAMLAASLLLVVGFNPFLTLLFAALEGSQYEDYKEMASEGANVLRVLVHGAPLAIAFLGRKRLRAICPHYDVMANLTLVGFVFMIVSTQNWIFARFSIYFGLYSLILTSWLANAFAERQRKLVYFAILVFYGAFFYFEHSIALRIVYRSAFIPW